MTLEYLSHAIGEIAIKANLVNYYGAGGSLYELNNDIVKEYPLVYVSPTGTHIAKENVTRYSITIFYADRLWEDNGNETIVCSTAIETLKNLHRQLPGIAWVTDVDPEPRIRNFTETAKMSDRLAGAYMDLWVEVQNPDICPVYFDAEGFPLGHWAPADFTPDIVQNLATKEWVLEQIRKMLETGSDT